MGEKALAWMARMEPMSSWNFANKVQLLQAGEFNLPFSTSVTQHP